MTVNHDDKILILLDNLRQMLDASRTEVLWMASNRGKIISACEDVITRQALEIAQLKTEAAVKSDMITDKRVIGWIDDMTATIVQQREDLVTERLKREQLSAEHSSSNDRTLALLEEMFGRVDQL